MRPALPLVRRVLRAALAVLLFATLALRLEAPAAAASGVSLTLHKSADVASGPLLTGQVVTYDLAYTWAGATPPQSLEIEDTLPLDMEVVPGNPPSGVNATATVLGTNPVTVRFTITPLPAPSGVAGHVRIPARFRPGAVCTDTTPRCNTEAWIQVGGDPSTRHALDVDAAHPLVCFSPKAVDGWTFGMRPVGGCACGQPLQFELAITCPAGGDLGGLDMVNPVITCGVPALATISSVVTTQNWGTFPAPVVVPIGANQLQITVPGTIPVRGGWSYFLYVEAVYPCGSFQPPYVAAPSASITYTTPCGVASTGTFPSNGQELCPATTLATVSKTLWINPDYSFLANTPCFCPGCCATYEVYYGNLGSLPITNPVIEDVLPVEEDVTEITTEVPAFMTQATVDVETAPNGASTPSLPLWPPSSVVVTATTNNPLSVTAPMGRHVSRVVWTYTGTIPSRQQVKNHVRVCNRTGAPGTTLTNTVKGTAAPDAIHVATVGPCGPRLLVRKELLGTACGDLSPDVAHAVGSTLRFRMHVANVGATAASPCTITDPLPIGVRYVGNETYYFGEMKTPYPTPSRYRPACADVSAANPPVSDDPLSGALGGPITASAAPWAAGTSQNVTWTVPTLPGRCDGVVDYVVVDFDVLLDPTMIAGTHVNRFTATAGGTSKTSNDVEFVVAAAPQWQVEKWVRLASGGSWGKSATAAPGAAVEYLLQVRNTGSVAITDVALLDVLPHVGDTFVLPTPVNGTASQYAARGSTFNLHITAGAQVTARTVTGSTALGTATVLTTLPQGAAAYFLPVAASGDPKRSVARVGSCGTPIADPTTSTGGAFAAQTSAGAPFAEFAVEIAGGSVVLAPGQALEVIVPATVPSTATVGQTACNSVAASASLVGGTGPCQVTQTLDAVCVTVVGGVPSGELQITKFDDANGNGIRDTGEAGLAGWTFAVTDASGALTMLTTTAGGDVVAAFPLGPVTAVEVGQPDWSPTTAALQTATVTAGPRPTLLFGNTRCGCGCELAIEKTMDPKPLVAGQTATATITVRNLGAKPCAGPIAVREAWTPGPSLTLQSASGAGWTWSGGPTAVFAGPLAGGASTTVTYTFLVSGRPGTEVRNCATLDAASDGDPKNNRSCVTVPIRPGHPVGTPDLAIHKSMAPTPLVAGQTATATITVTNVGTGPTTGPTTLTETWTPASALSLVGANGSGWTVGGGSTATYAAPIQPEQSVTITYTFTVTGKPGTGFVNCATVKTAGDVRPENDKSCVDGKIRPGAPDGFDLAVKKTMAPNPLVPGQQATATLQVTNQGPGVANGPITVTDAWSVPGALSLVGVSGTTAGWTWSGGASATWNGSMPPNTSIAVTYTFTVTGKPGTVVTNCATVAAQGDTNPANDRSCVEVPIREVAPAPFDLAIRKSMAPRPLVVGGAATATITVVNTGPGPCPGPIQVTDVWSPPTALVLTGAGGVGWTCVGGTCTHPGPLAAGQSLTLSYAYQVRGPAGTVVTNCATVASRGDVNSANNRSCVEVPVVRPSGPVPEPVPGPTPGDTPGKTPRGGTGVRPGEPPPTPPAPQTRRPIELRGPSMDRIAGTWRFGRIATASGAFVELGADGSLTGAGLRQRGAKWASVRLAWSTPPAGGRSEVEDVVVVTVALEGGGELRLPAAAGDRVTSLAWTVDLPDGTVHETQWSSTTKPPRGRRPQEIVIVSLPK